MGSLSKYKQVLRELLGDNIATWLHAARFAYLLSATKKLYSEVDMLLIENFQLKSSIVIDVGANSANWTKVLSKQVGEHGKVYAFEADPYYATVTEKVIKILGISNVMYFGFGLSDKSEILPLEIIDSNGQRVSGTGRIVESKKISESQVVNIKLESLDRLASKYPELWRTKFIKCDVEGFELKVLQGASEVIKYARPIVVAEVDKIFTQENDEENLFSFFKVRDYDSYVVVSQNHMRTSWESGDIPEGVRPNRIFFPREFQFSNIIKIER